MEQYFKYLDDLRKDGPLSLALASIYLKMKFKELNNDSGASRRIAMAWKSGFSMGHVCPALNGTQFEALFLYGDLLNNLACRLSEVEGTAKCALCGDADLCKGRWFMPSCGGGIAQGLANLSAEYMEDMKECCQAYFSYLDKLNASASYRNINEAEDELVAEFPYLASHREYAKYAVASWLLGFWPSEHKEAEK